MNGEYLLSLDPYNFNTEEEYIKFYDPEMYKRINKENEQKKDRRNKSKNSRSY